MSERRVIRAARRPDGSAVTAAPIPAAAAPNPFASVAPPVAADSAAPVNPFGPATSPTSTTSASPVHATFGASGAFAAQPQPANLFASTPPQGQPSSSLFGSSATGASLFSASPASTTAGRQSQGSSLFGSSSSNASGTWGGESQPPSRRGVCGEWLKGRCMRGNLCAFAHDKSTEPTCRDWLKGLCTRGDGCRFKHDDNATLRPCADFLRGRCAKGDQCKFKHEGAQQQQQQQQTFTEAGPTPPGGLSSAPAAVAASSGFGSAHPFPQQTTLLFGAAPAAITQASSLCGASANAQPAAGFAAPSFGSAPLLPSISVTHMPVSFAVFPSVIDLHLDATALESVLSAASVRAEEIAQLEPAIVAAHHVHSQLATGGQAPAQTDLPSLSSPSFSSALSALPLRELHWLLLQLGAAQAALARASRADKEASLRTILPAVPSMLAMQQRSRAEQRAAEAECLSADEQATLVEQVEAMLRIKTLDVTKEQLFTLVPAEEHEQQDEQQGEHDEEGEDDVEDGQAHDEDDFETVEVSAEQHQEVSSFSTSASASASSPSAPLPFDGAMDGSGWMSLQSLADHSLVRTRGVSVSHVRAAVLSSPWLLLSSDGSSARARRRAELMGNGLAVLSADQAGAAACIVGVMAHRHRAMASAGAAGVFGPAAVALPSVSWFLQDLLSHELRQMDPQLKAEAVTAVRWSTALTLEGPSAQDKARHTIRWLKTDAEQQARCAQFTLREDSGRPRIAPQTSSAFPVASAGGPSFLSAASFGTSFPSASTAPSYPFSRTVNGDRAELRMHLPSIVVLRFPSGSIQRWSEQSGASINVSRADGQGRREIVISGHPAHCEAARRWIEQCARAIEQAGGADTSFQSTAAAQVPFGGFSSSATPAATATAAAQSESSPTIDFGPFGDCFVSSAVTGLDGFGQSITENVRAMLRRMYNGEASPMSHPCSTYLWPDHPLPQALTVTWADGTRSSMQAGSYFALHDQVRQAILSRTAKAKAEATGATVPVTAAAAAPAAATFGGFAAATSGSTALSSAAAPTSFGGFSSTATAAPPSIAPASRSFASSSSASSFSRPHPPPQPSVDFSESGDCFVSVAIWSASGLSATEELRAMLRRMYNGEAALTGPDDLSPDRPLPRALTVTWADGAEVPFKQGEYFQLHHRVGESIIIRKAQRREEKNAEAEAQATAAAALVAAESQRDSVSGSSSGNECGDWKLYGFCRYADACKWAHMKHESTPAAAPVVNAPSSFGSSFSSGFGFGFALPTNPSVSAASSAAATIDAPFPAVGRLDPAGPQLSQYALCGEAAESAHYEAMMLSVPAPFKPSRYRVRQLWMERSDPPRYSLWTHEGNIGTKDDRSSKLTRWGDNREWAVAQWKQAFEKDTKIEWSQRANAAPTPVEGAEWQWHRRPNETGVADVAGVLSFVLPFKQPAVPANAFSFGNASNAPSTSASLSAVGPTAAAPTIVPQPPEAVCYVHPSCPAFFVPPPSSTTNPLSPGVQRRAISVALPEAPLQLSMLYIVPVCSAEDIEAEEQANSKQKKESNKRLTVDDGECKEEPIAASSLASASSSSAASAAVAPSVSSSCSFSVRICAINRFQRLQIGFRQNSVFAQTHLLQLGAATEGAPRMQGHGQIDSKRNAKKLRTEMAPGDSLFEDDDPTSAEKLPPPSTGDGPLMVPVDPQYRGRTNATVLQDSDGVWEAHLTCAPSKQTHTVLQLLVLNLNGSVRYGIGCRWRTSKTTGRYQLRHTALLDAAKRVFRERFQAITMNAWADRDKFVVRNRFKYEPREYAKVESASSYSASSGSVVSASASSSASFSSADSSSLEPPNDVESRILKQVEFYLSPSNLSRDVFLRHVSEREGGWIPVATLASFKRMESITTDLTVITAALRKSRLLKLSDDGTKITTKDNDVPPSLPPVSTVTVAAAGLPSTQRVAAVPGLRVGSVLTCRYDRARDEIRFSFNGAELPDATIRSVLTRHAQPAGWDVAALHAMMPVLLLRGSGIEIECVAEEEGAKEANRITENERESEEKANASASSLTVPSFGPSSLSASTRGSSSSSSFSLSLADAPLRDLSGDLALLRLNERAVSGSSSSERDHHAEQAALVECPAAVIPAYLRLLMHDWPMSRALGLPYFPLAILDLIAGYTHRSAPQLGSRDFGFMRCWAPQLRGQVRPPADPRLSAVDKERTVAWMFEPRFPFASRQLAQVGALAMLDANDDPIRSVYHSLSMSGEKAIAAAQRQAQQEAQAAQRQAQSLFISPAAIVKTAASEADEYCALWTRFADRHPDQIRAEDYAALQIDAEEEARVALEMIAEERSGDGSATTVSSPAAESLDSGEVRESPVVQNVLTSAKSSRGVIRDEDGAVVLDSAAALPPGTVPESSSIPAFGKRTVDPCCPVTLADVLDDYDVTLGIKAIGNQPAQYTHLQLLWSADRLMVWSHLRSESVSVRRQFLYDGASRDVAVRAFEGEYMSATGTSWSSRLPVLAAGDLQSMWREVAAAPGLSAETIASVRAQPVQPTRPGIGGFSSGAAASAWGGSNAFSSSTIPSLSSSIVTGNPFGGAAVSGMSNAPFLSAPMPPSTGGTRWCQFRPLSEIAAARDPSGRIVHTKGVYQSITAMPAYEQFTFEELRDQDERIGINEPVLPPGLPPAQWNAYEAPSTGLYAQPTPSVGFAPPRASASRVPCIAWQTQAGSCKFGDRCRFGHDTE